MQQEIEDLGGALVAEARKAVGGIADRWNDDDRAKVLQAGIAVARYGTLLATNPDIAEIDRPIIESVVARLKSISTAEAGVTLEKFFAGAMKVLEIGLPILIRLIPK